jgi:hypothetical protein
MKKILWGIIIMVVVGVGYFVWNDKPAVAPISGTVYENQYMKIVIPGGWVATEAIKKVYGQNGEEVLPNPAAVNITKGNYILYINTEAFQASGVEGGRFAEIAMGAPSAEAVVTSWPSQCGVSDVSYPRVDLYVGPSDKEDWCNVPTNKTVWFFSYISGESPAPSGLSYFNYYTSPRPNGADGYVITMSYNSKDVNTLPEKGSSELNQMLSEITDIVKTLQIKIK